MGRISVLYLLFAIINIIITEFACNGDSNHTDCLESNREALIEFKNGLKDPENRLSSWHGSNCCQWRGIKCEDRIGTVTVIDLHNPFPSSFDFATRYEFWNLTGEVRPSLLKLKSLTHLDLSFNTFQDIPIPQFFASLKNLQYLNLSNAGFNNIIPPNLGNLSSLKYLDVSSESYILSVNSLQWMSGLVSLKHLVMNQVDLSLVGSSWVQVLNTLPFLTELHLSQCNLSGSISSPSSINFTALEVVDLSDNNFNSKFPDWLSNITSLVRLDMSNSALHGRIPHSFGQLSELSFLDVSSNHFTGTISEVHFSKLSNLKFLLLSSNSFILNVSSNWVPPFQVRNLDMGSCHLGPSFPTWLESQKELTYLDVSNASISGSIPTWFWDISSNMWLLNVSLNQLSGQLPNPLKVAPFSDIDFSSNLFEGPIPLPIVGFMLLDLSKNRFSGPIPQNISESMSKSMFLSISSNRLTGEIPSTFGENSDFLEVIDLSRNNFTGSIPASIGNCSILKALDLGNNSLSGVIPSSLGQLKMLQSLHLNGNMFFGEIPSSFMNLSSLETLDLHKNMISGNIPTWFGVGFANLRILKLRFNAISGGIPTELSHLSSLQVLDLAYNNLTGGIPASLGDLKAMAQEQKVNRYLLYGTYRGHYYEESLVVNIKGGPLKYTKTMSLVTSIDLSGNNLNGDFPVHITKLSGLLALDLSSNQIGGQIPENISSMRQLSSLDLSSNKLSGAIPPNMSSLTFLGYLNLSDNNFSGRIPYKGQMTTFSASTFAGNPGLCGPPLVVKCQGEDSDQPKTVENDDDNDNDDFIDKWFYLSVGLGFAVGLLVPFLIIATRKPWSNAYFNFVDKIVYRLPCVTNRRAIRKW